MSPWCLVYGDFAWPSAKDRQYACWCSWIVVLDEDLIWGLWWVGVVGS